MLKVGEAIMPSGYIEGKHGKMDHESSQSKNEFKKKGNWEINVAFQRTAKQSHRLSAKKRRLPYRLSYPLRLRYTPKS